MIRRLLTPTPFSFDWAALALRVAFCGLMVYNHGMMKMTLFSESPDSFPDPVGLGASNSYYLAVFAEAVCAGLVLAGFLTRLALLPLLFTMAVAVLVVNWQNPMSDKELPLLYLAVYTAVFLLGPGRFSIDARLWKSR